MKLTVIGVGYVGQVTGTCLAEMGNDVVCLDVDADKVAQLNTGEPTIYERGLRELLEKNVREERLSFTTDARTAIRFGDIIFICVNTPESSDGSADLSYYFSAAATIAAHMDRHKIIVTKSTVPVGTGRKLKDFIASRTKQLFDIASNPEFLREGRAVRDFMVPDRVIIGADSADVGETLQRLYKGFILHNRPILVMDIPSAELVKYASNAMLATRISFMNMLTSLCEKVGADVKNVAEGIGMDERIGPRFLQAGLGFGGSCFPKDVHALVHMLHEAQGDTTLLRSVLAINAQQRNYFLAKIKEIIRDRPSPIVAIWGLSFKPDTDDLRHAPSLTIIHELLRMGAKVQAFDPIASEHAKKVLPASVTYGHTPYEAAQGADAVILVTEWNEFRQLDWKKLKGLMRTPLFLDGRNVLDPSAMRKEGFIYHSVGRP